MDAITEYVNRYQTGQAAREAEAQAKQQARINGLIERLTREVAIWLPDDILAALAPTPAYLADKGNPVTVQMDVTYKGEKGHIRLTQYSDGSGTDAALEFGSSANYAVKMHVDVVRSAMGQTRTIRPAGADELGELFYMLDRRQASERAQEKMKAANAAWQTIYSLGTESEMREWYANVYLPEYGDVAPASATLERVISDRKTNERYEAEAAAERKREVAEQAAERAAYDARKAVAEAEAAALFHPFTVYRIEYGAVVSDGDGSAGPALDNVYSLDAAPDAEGWYRRVTGGNVTKVRIPGAVLIEEVKVETVEHARYLPVCKWWSKDGARFCLPPDSVLVGAGEPTDSDGDGDSAIPF